MSLINLSNLIWIWMFFGASFLLHFNCLPFDRSLLKTSNNSKFQFHLPIGIPATWIDLACTIKEISKSIVKNDGVVTVPPQHVSRRSQKTSPDRWLILSPSECHLQDMKALSETLNILISHSKEIGIEWIFCADALSSECLNTYFSLQSFHHYVIFHETILFSTIPSRIETHSNSHRIVSLKNVFPTPGISKLENDEHNVPLIQRKCYNPYRIQVFYHLQSNNSKPNELDYEKAAESFALLLFVFLFWAIVSIYLCIDSLSERGRIRDRNGTFGNTAGLVGISRNDRRTLTSIDLRLLPLKTFVPLLSERLESETFYQRCDEVMCPICLQDYSPGQTIRVLTCQHQFHNQCVDRWLTQESARCPLCQEDCRKHM